MLARIDASLSSLVDPQSFSCFTNKDECLFVSRAHRVSDPHDFLKGVACVERLALAQEELADVVIRCNKIAITVHLL